MDFFFLRKSFVNVTLAVWFFTKKTIAELQELEHSAKVQKKYFFKKCHPSREVLKMESFSLQKKIFCRFAWIGTFCRGNFFPKNRKFFHFSDFFENSENLLIWAYNCFKFQQKIVSRKWHPRSRNLSKKVQFSKFNPDFIRKFSDLQLSPKFVNFGAQKCAKFQQNPARNFRSGNFSDFFHFQKIFFFCRIARIGTFCRGNFFPKNRKFFHFFH